MWIVFCVGHLGYTLSLACLAERLMLRYSLKADQRDQDDTRALLVL